MKRSGNILTWCLFALAVCGAALGPGYLIYGWFISGSAAGEHPVTVGKPLELELNPDMNPIRFNMAIEYRKGISAITERTDFRAALRDDNRKLWTTTFGVSQSNDQDRQSRRESGFRIGTRSTVTSYSSIRMFSVERPGRYVFLVVPGRRSELHVQGLTLKVRQNVVGVNTPLAIAGFVMLGVAVVGGLVKLFMMPGKTGSQKQ